MEKNVTGIEIVAKFLELRMRSSESIPTLALAEVFKTNSKVTELRTYDEWKKIGRQVNKGEKGFGYADKKSQYRSKQTFVFDVKQTRGKHLLEMILSSKDFEIAFNELNKDSIKIFGQDLLKFKEQIKSHIKLEDYGLSTAVDNEEPTEEEINEYYELLEQENENGRNKDSNSIDEQGGDKKSSIRLDNRTNSGSRKVPQKREGTSVGENTSFLDGIEQESREVWENDRKLSHQDELREVLDIESRTEVTNRVDRDGEENQPISSREQNGENNQRNDSREISSSIRNEQVEERKISEFYQKYLQEQAKKPNAIIINRQGDFYEIFGKNSKLVAERLDLTITSRDVGLDERVETVGFPYQLKNESIGKIVEFAEVVLIDGEKTEFWVKIENPKDENIDIYEYIKGLDKTKDFYQLIQNKLAILDRLGKAPEDWEIKKIQRIADKKFEELEKIEEQTQQVEHQPISILVKRVGDFYEIYGESAILVADKLDLTLTSKVLEKNERVAMVGFPYHIKDEYIEKITEFSSVQVIENGEVTIFDRQQTEQEEHNKNIVKIHGASYSKYQDYVVLSHYTDDWKMENISLGKKANYDNRGHYDNSDNSLIIVSQNGKMFSLLEGSHYVLTKEEMIKEGHFTEQDFKEYEEICQKFDNKFVRVKEVEFGVSLDDSASAQTLEKIGNSVIKDKQVGYFKLSEKLNIEAFAKIKEENNGLDQYVIVAPVSYLSQAESKANGITFIKLGRDISEEALNSENGFNYLVEVVDQLSYVDESCIVANSLKEAERIANEKVQLTKKPYVVIEWSELGRVFKDNTVMDFESANKLLTELNRKYIEELGYYKTKLHIITIDGSYNAMRFDLGSEADGGLVEHIKRFAQGESDEKKLIEFANSLEGTTQEEKETTIESNILNLSVKDWYLQEYATDELGEEIKDISFAELYNFIENKEDVHSYLADDSIVRERCFTKLAELIGTSYNAIYTQWLKSTETKAEGIEDKENVTTINFELPYSDIIEVSNILKLDDYKTEFVLSDNENNNKAYTTAREQGSTIYEQYSAFYGADNKNIKLYYNNEIMFGGVLIETKDFTRAECENLSIKEVKKLADLFKQVGAKNVEVISNNIIEETEANQEVEQQEQVEIIEQVSKAIDNGNYCLTEEDFIIRSPKERLNDNITAIKLVKQLEEENRQATIEEQQQLAKYVGWGGLADAFDTNKTVWASERNELKSILSEEEYKQAEATVLNAHFTPKNIIDGIYYGLNELGLKKAKALETSCGTGNFIGCVPNNMNITFDGVEIDSLTSRIARNLYPAENIQNKGFEEVSVKDNTYDLVIGNVPFGNYKVYDKDYNKYKFVIHDYFLAKSIDKLKPNGVMAVITGKGTMDKQDCKARKYLATKGELLGAFRLPNNAFKSNAGTEVVADILFFKKRENEILETEFSPKDREWVYVDKKYNNVDYINSYFLTHPDNVIGELAVTSGQFGNVITVNPTNENLTEQLQQAMSELANASCYSGVAKSVVEVKETVEKLAYDNNSAYVVFNDCERIGLHENTIMDFESASKLIKSLKESEIKGRVNLSFAYVKEYEFMFYENIYNYNLSTDETNLLDALKGESLGVAYWRSNDITLKRIGADIESLQEEHHQNNIVIDTYNVKETTTEESEEVDSIICFEDGKLDEMNIKNYSLCLYNNRAYIRENNNLTLPNSKILQGELKGTTIQKINSYLSLKEQVNKIINIQLENCSDEVLEEEQKRLNDLYDKFVKDYSYVSNKTNNCFMEDIDYALVCSIENVNEDTNEVTKQPIFYQRTIQTQKAKEYTDDVFEALAICESELGGVDIHYIEKLTKLSYDEVISRLNNEIFKNPNEYTLREENLKYEGWVSRADYLSGNIREKLAFVDYYLEKKDYENEQVGNTIKNILTQNKEELERIKPKDISYENIKVRIGASWIEDEDYKLFICELLDSSWGVEVERNNLDGGYSVKIPKYTKETVQGTSTWGTSRKNAGDIFSHLLNNETINVYDKIEVDGKEKRVLNKEETMFARAKAKELNAEFERWVWQDERRRAKYEDIYNNTFNSIVLPEYNGDNLTFNGMTNSIKLRKHQLDCVARISKGRNVLLHHCVGAGKTFTMIAGAVKLKEYGLCQKPMFVVPNSLLLQWASEIKLLYPQLNLLVPNKKDFEKENRKRFIAKIATGNWDIVLLTEEQFLAIPISEEFQIRKKQEERENLVNTKNRLAEERGKGFTIKKIAEAIKKLDAELSMLQETLSNRQDKNIPFEKLGVDYLFVDEAHKYKNKRFYTSMSNVAGLNPDGSQRAYDMSMKIDFIRELHGGEDKGVVFATGTPISNSMAEMYIMQSYLGSNDLKRAKIEFFDAWASTFGEVVDTWELSTTGNKLKARKRFSKFVNLPELQTMYREFADVKTADMLDLPTPKANKQTITIPATSQIIALNDELIERGEKIENREVSPDVDNMLKLCSDGKKLALDVRCLDEVYQDEEGSKVNVLISNVFDIYKNTETERMTQVIFCDASTPKNDSWNIYQDIKEKLVKMGIPSEEIAFIHNAKTDESKKAMFQAMNKGVIRILIGSTEKSGVGANFQVRLKALHHLDVPYRPSDLEQREGRIIRQGNINKEVDIFSYVTEKTFDSYSYQILETKQKFISQINNGDMNIREAGDIDEATLSFAQIKAIATANPDFLRQMQLVNTVKELRMIKSKFYENKKIMLHKINETLPSEIKRLEDRYKRLSQDVQDMFNDNGEPKDTAEQWLVGNTLFTERAKAGELLQSMMNSCKNEEKIGEYKGFDIIVNKDLMFVKKLVLKRNIIISFDAGDSGLGNVLRIENTFKAMPTKKKDLNNEILNLKKQLEEAKVGSEKEWDRNDELRNAEAELEMLEKKLRVNEEEIIDENETSSQIKNQENTSFTKAYFEAEEKYQNTIIIQKQQDCYKVLGQSTKIVAEELSLEINSESIDGVEIETINIPLSEVAKSVVRLNELYNVALIEQGKEPILKNKTQSTGLQAFRNNTESMNNSYNEQEENIED